MTRSFPLRALMTALTALLISGCQSIAFGVANHGVPKADASVVYDDAHGLSLDLYKPIPGTDTPAPVVVFFYGGGWKRGARDGYRFVGHRLAKNGMLAFVADYRTFPKTTFPGFVEDGARAVAWARQHAARYGGDPQRIFVAGHSAGAQIAGLLGTDARYLAAVGIKPRDLAGVIGLSGPYDFVIDHEYGPVFGPRSQWTQAMAVNFVDGDEPPFLLIHGTGDKVVAFHESEELAQKLRAHQVQVQLVTLPGGSHLGPLTALYSTRRDPTVLEAINAFVQSHPAQK